MVEGIEFVCVLLLIQHSQMEKALAVTIAIYQTLGIGTTSD